MTELIEHIYKVAVLEERVRQNEGNSIQGRSTAGMLSKSHALSGIVQLRSTSRSGGTRSGIVTGSSSATTASSLHIGGPQMHSVNNDDDELTLWEKKQFCVRFIIEENKLNLMLRFMNSFKVAQMQVFEKRINLAVCCRT